MRRVLACLLAFCLTNVSLLEAGPASSHVAASFQEDYDTYEQFSPEQLDNLLAPIALYPDPLLSQILVAATFVDQVDEAARWVRAYGANGIDDQPWDVSVKAVAHYPTVIAMMADKLDWTTTLGQAYVNQSTDVMISIQRLRHMAYSVGNLVTTPQQQVLLDDDLISIVPVQPQYIYVPVYDPYICYYRRPFWGAAITFGIGFIIGAWLNRDCDWRHRRVYYHGWNGPGWIGRGRPFVRVTNVYVNNRFNELNLNRNVMRRNVNVNNIDRFRSIHRDVDYRNIRDHNARLDRFNNVRPPDGANRPPVNNRMINRNIDTTNPRYDRYRGRETAPGQNRPPRGQPQPQPQPGVQRPDRQPRTQPQPGAQPPDRQPRTQPQPGAQPPDRQPRTQPQPGVQPPGRPTPPPPSSVRLNPRLQPVPRVFNNPDGNIDPRASSQRGQSSRQEAKRPAPTPRPAPRTAPRSAPAPRPSTQPTPRPAPQPRGQGNPKPHGGGEKP